ncbi:MAG TPA: right-handed parallel beta-helix repeat-containing protein [Anaerolineae bacterium]|nr:right-handed parallel beta-helix repeat-containing protein [Anaerolineae bacterium]
MSAIRSCPRTRLLSFILSLFIVMALVLIVDLMFAQHGASAAPTITIKVNTTADNNAPDNFISLREAILLVNGGTGGNGSRTGLGRSLSTNEAAQIVGGTITTTGVAANIIFTDLPGGSTIVLSSGTVSTNESLPPILTSGIVINGLNGAGGRIKIDGSGAGVPANSDILWLGWAVTTTNTIPVSDITIQSISITGAKRYGLHLNPARSSHISQCDITQSTSYAILIQGKFSAADGNIIEDCTVGPNQSLGIVINRPGAFNNIIRNNRIGTDAAGTAPAPNTGAGMAFFSGANHNVITGNLISGNTLQGIFFYNPNTNNNEVYNNRIGTAANGTSALPNVQGIVFGDGASNNIVGGTGVGQANLIAFNTESGVVVANDATIGNKISGNSIFQNGILGIDLLDDKLPTVGVSGGGLGPNRLALRPTLTKAQVRGALANVAGTASPNSTIELFVAEPNLSGLGSGKTYCTTVTADGSGAFKFFGTLACAPGAGALTATSTLPDGSTSEFGNNLATTALPSVFLPVMLR